MKTEKLFVKDVYLKEGDLKVCAVDDSLLESDGTIKLAFESTFFFPFAGGQLCDLGTVADFPVLDVAEEKGTEVLWHKVDVKGNKDVFKVGESYRAVLDWERRFKHMQMHCGEHILSGVFHRLYGAENKGFHMGDEYVTIDIDYEGGELSKEQIEIAELEANKAVWLNLPVVTKYFDTIKEALEAPLRKKIKAEEDISVVFVGEGPSMVDCCACCGTHPNTTGQIGLIKVVHHEKYKGMNRFYVKFGRDALLDYTNKDNVLCSLARRYSCEYQDLEKALDSSDARNQQVYKEYSELKNSLLKKEEDRLREELKDATGYKIFSFSTYSADDLQNLATKLGEDIKNLTAFISEKEAVCILASSGKPACGALIKENATKYGGKGGGKPNLARAIFTSLENALEFAQSFTKSSI